MKRYRLNELPLDRGLHIFAGIVPGEFISQGEMKYKPPGHVAHADTPIHVHEDHAEIFVILQGRARVRFDDYVEHLKAGDVIVIDPGENHHLESDEEDPCINLYLHCGPERHPDQLG